MFRVIQHMHHISLALHCDRTSPPSCFGSGANGSHAIKFDGNHEAAKRKAEAWLKAELKKSKKK